MVNIFGQYKWGVRGSKSHDRVCMNSMATRVFIGQHSFTVLFHFFLSFYRSHKMILCLWLMCVAGWQEAVCCQSNVQYRKGHTNWMVKDLSIASDSTGT